MTVTAAARPSAYARKTDRLFYGGMAALIGLTVFLGFAPSYYLEGVFHQGRPLTPLAHLHGVVFSSWIIFLLLQASLVSARRTAVHRKLGIAGAVLAAAMVVIGLTAAVMSARAGTNQAPGLTPQQFLIIPFADMAVFAPTVAAAIWFRKRPEIHKRLILVATIALIIAAVARLPALVPGGFAAFAAWSPAAVFLFFFALTDLFLVAAIAYDFATRGRVHPAYLWAGGWLVLSQPLRLWLMYTPAWAAVARALVG